MRGQWTAHGSRPLDYGIPQGLRALREAIARHIAITRGVRCTPHQVIVTSGSQQAFDILFHLLLDPGDSAWIEEPGYLDVRGALVAAGATLVPVPVDVHGLDVAAGMARAIDAKVAVVSPSHQYPSGATLSATRRAQLLQWARASGAWVIEDDYDSDFRYRGRPVPALEQLDRDTALANGIDPRVLYVGSFSKTMFPSLRLGFCVVPDELVDAVANARAIAGRNSPIVDQAALAQFIDDGHYDRHLRRVRLVCQERHEAMRHHFARVLGGAVSLGAASAGTHVLGRPGEDIRKPRSAASVAVAIAAAAAEDDLVVFPLSRYCLEPLKRDALVLGYGGLTPRRISLGVERLARSIDRVIAAGGR